MSKKYYEKLLCDIQNQSKPVESKFGSYILQKFGWEKGKGLGKNENGDVNIMKIKKYGEHGLGYKEQNEEQHDKMWWENMYNSCAKKITNDNDKDEKLKNNQDEKLKNNQDENLKYSIFVKKNNCIISAFCDNYPQNSPNEKEDNHNSHTNSDNKNSNKNCNVFKIKHKEINKEKHKMNNHLGNNYFYNKKKLANNNNNNFMMNKSKNKKKWKKM